SWRRLLYFRAFRGGTLPHCVKWLKSAFNEPQIVANIDCRGKLGSAARRRALASELFFSKLPPDALPATRICRNMQMRSAIGQAAAAFYRSRISVAFKASPYAVS